MKKQAITVLVCAALFSGCTLPKLTGDTADVESADIAPAFSEEVLEEAEAAETAEETSTAQPLAEVGEAEELSVLPESTAPCGIAAVGNAIYVTDTYGKLIWRLENDTASVFAGKEDAVQDIYGQPVGGYNDDKNSEALFGEPWDVAPFLDGIVVSDPANAALRYLTNGVTGTLDVSVKLEQPRGLAADDTGALYVSDTARGEIYKINTDGKAERVARHLDEPTGLCYANGTLYVALTGSNQIAKIENGKTEILAGSGDEGFSDGNAKTATFSAPQGIAVDESGALYVADTVNGAVRRVANEEVTTIYAQTGETLQTAPVSPTGLLISGNTLYVCDPFARKLSILSLSL